MSWVQSGRDVVNFSTWGFSIYKTAHRIGLRILSMALEKELKVLEYAQWLHYYYLVSSIFLCFHISLIKLILWLKFSTDRKEVARAVEWQGPFHGDMRSALWPVRWSRSIRSEGLRETSGCLLHLFPYFFLPSLVPKMYGGNINNHMSSMKV